VFERPRSGERALLVRLGLGAPVDPEDLQEFTQLALSAGAQPVATVTGRRDEVPGRIELPDDLVAAAARFSSSALPLPTK